METPTTEQKGFARFLGVIERVGNALPHPATLFALFAGLVIVFSWVFSLLDIEAVMPRTGEVIRPVNRVSVEGLHRSLTEMITNFTGFAPLGTVLVALLGIGVAERSGLIGTGIRLLVLSAPPRLLTFVIVMAGVLSKMGAFGFIRFAVPLCQDVAQQLAPLVMLLAAISIVYGAVLALRQQHYKMLVAYASLSHMGYIVLGLFSLQPAGIHGAMVQVLSHGLAVAGLFLVLGLLEQRRGPQWLQVHGLATRAPRIAVVVMLFVLASLALPLTSGFAAEFRVLLGAFTTGYSHWLAGAGPGMLIAALLAATGVVLGATYMLQFARSLVFDDSTVADTLPDLRVRELLALAPLLLLIAWIGVQPALWMDKVDAALTQIARATSVALMGANHDE